MSPKKPEYRNGRYVSWFKILSNRGTKRINEIAIPVNKQRRNFIEDGQNFPILKEVMLDRSF